MQKILTNGGKGIKKRARLKADAAVHNFRLLIERIAGADYVLFITDGELKLAGEHIGELLVRAR